MITSEERFWSKVNKTDTCWLWEGGRTWGYGMFWDGQRTMRAHRWAYEQVRGPIPGELQLDHLCRVKHCVRPSHLEAVTNRVNTLRGYGPTAINARKTQCDNGHPYTESNTYRHSKGRQCRICRYAGQRRQTRRRQQVRERYLEPLPEVPR